MSGNCARRAAKGVGAILLGVFAVLHFPVPGSAVAPVAAEPARRIVSINLCTDQLVMLLADREDIASISFLAADRFSSPMHASSGGLNLNSGRAEEILSLSPDVVLAGDAAGGPAIGLLRSLGVRVVTLPLAASLADVSDQIRRVARAIGRPQRGERLVADFGRGIGAAANPAERPLAVLFGSNGVTSGRGTLVSDAIRHAGFENLAARRGLTGVGRVSLESVVTAHPDLLIIGSLGASHSSLADESLRHPALKKLPRTTRVVIPDPLWACPTPFVAVAIDKLRAARP